MREYVEKQLHTRVDCEPNDASEITTQNSCRNNCVPRRTGAKEVRRLY